jgi:hypothetical protein
MATPVRWRLVPGAIDKLLRDPGVAADLERRGRAIAAAAGPGHDVAPDPGPHRARVTVATATLDAVLDELLTRNLTRAVDAGRQ